MSLTSVDSSSNNKDNEAIIPDSVASSIDYRLADTTNSGAHSSHSPLMASYIMPAVSYKGVCTVDHTSMSDTADSCRLPSVLCKTVNTVDHSCDTMTCSNKYTACLGSGPDSSSNCAT